MKKDAEHPLVVALHNRRHRDDESDNIREGWSRGFSFLRVEALSKRGSHLFTIISESFFGTEGKPGNQLSM